MTATATYLRSIAAAIRPDDKVTITEWAARHRVLPVDTPEPGPWRNERTPYCIDIQNTMSPGSPMREGWVKKGHQVGGSAIGENFIGHAICAAAGSMMVVFPTLEDAKQWELSRFEEMRKSTRELRRRVRDADRTGSNNTKLRKKYPGGVMRLVGANRVGALKSATIRYVKFEEPDEFALDIGDQGDPITLAKKRTSNFGNKAKIYGDGTPTVEGRSAIDRQFKRGDQRRWQLCCPECGHAQPLEFKQIKWDDGDPSTAQYFCISCGVGHAEHVWKGRNYARSVQWSEEECAARGVAHWKATAAGERGVASWHLPSLAAPLGWRPWTRLAADWISAQGDEEALKAFTNNELGECWAEKRSSELSGELLRQRAENYPLMTAPRKALVVVASVDTQDNRLAVEIRAYGRGEESWGLHHGEIMGSPAMPDTWAKLRELLEAPIAHESGQVIKVDACAIDMGGHHGEDVLAFCRDAQLRGRHWFAIQGATKYDAPKLGKPRQIDFTWRGKPVPGGATVRYVGTQSIKNLLHSRLTGVLVHGAGYVHFPLGYEAEYFAQVVAEKREWRRDRTGKKALWWVKTSARNEAWDLLVYGYAAFLYAMAGRHAEVVWREREKIYGEVHQLDLLQQRAQEAVANAPVQQAPAAPIQPSGRIKRVGRVGGLGRFRP
jgi:phage terminase large subunit GpA-like protein